MRDSPDLETVECVSKHKAVITDRKVTVCAYWPSENK